MTEHIQNPITTTFIDTDIRYDTIISMPDATARQQSYITQFVQPWSQMMEMTAGHLGGQDNDPLAGARMWHWLLPDKMATVPDALTRLKDVDAWTKGRQAMTAAAKAFSPHADQIPFDTAEGWCWLIQRLATRLCAV
jgi:hypothetical protein